SSLSLFLGLFRKHLKLPAGSRCVDKSILQTLNFELFTLYSFRAIGMRLTVDRQAGSLFNLKIKGLW
ncbi:MAG: hypothetical protein KAI96_05550, partial [Thermodesulfovibrionia bacterium]|nr:hypothetical protein [Thermodesulfovibrionia bacterium]